jgi:hypothetical protein
MNKLNKIFSFDLNSFRGAECLGNPELKLDISQLSPLLEKDMLAAVTDVFINERKQKFTEWLPNIITQEVKVCIHSKTLDLGSSNLCYKI